MGEIGKYTTSAYALLRAVLWKKSRRTFYTALLQGLSIQARDGASREALHAVVDAAMAAWDTLTGPLARPDRP